MQVELNRVHYQSGGRGPRLHRRDRESGGAEPQRAGPAIRCGGRLFRGEVVMNSGPQGHHPPAQRMSLTDHPNLTRQHRTKMLQTVAFSSGTGKSHFVEALAHAAIEADLRVAWFT